MGESCIQSVQLPGWGLFCDTSAYEGFACRRMVQGESARIMSASSHIPRQSLTSAVADKLRDKIVRGEIHEGEQLRQDAIANEFQVSRIPVREALRQLEAEGLITIVLHRGAVVSSLSPTDIVEV